MMEMMIIMIMNMKTMRVIRTSTMKMIKTMGNMNMIENILLLMKTVMWQVVM